MFEWMNTVKIWPLLVLVNGLAGMIGVLAWTLHEERPALLWWELPIINVVAVTMAFLMQ